MFPVPVIGMTVQTFFFILTKTQNERVNNEGWRDRLSVPAGRPSIFIFSVFIISPITVVEVQLKGTNSQVLILASKEDKDK